MRFRLPSSRSFPEKRFQVEGISDFIGKRSVKKDSEKRTKYQKSLRKKSVENGQFSALSNSHLNLGSFKSWFFKSLRHDVVNSLRGNRFLNGISLQDFTARPLHEYLNEMAKDGVYGDEITLKCIANLFSIEIIIISTLGNGVSFHPP